MSKNTNPPKPDLSPQALAGLIDSMARELAGRLPPEPLMIGIHTGGAWVAAELMGRLNLEPPLGTIDISFYRDDYSRIGMHPNVRGSELPVDVDDRHIILVDDVLYTGRTIRAALNEIFDFGRPASIMLVVLFERDGRELPIKPDISGQVLDLGTGQQIKLTGPEPLGAEIRDIDRND